MFKNERQYNLFVNIVKDILMVLVIVFFYAQSHGVFVSIWLIIMGGLAILVLLFDILYSVLKFFDLIGKEK